MANPPRETQAGKQTNPTRNPSDTGQRPGQPGPKKRPMGEEEEE